MSHGSTDSDSSPSMHRFWTVPELMSMVCEELQGPDGGSDENGDGEGDRTEFKSLTILARTCKFLSEPALDIIWSQLDNTTPLWFCLGHDIWESREGDLLVSHRILLLDIVARFSDLTISGMPVFDQAHRTSAVDQVPCTCSSRPISRGQG